MKQLYFLLFTAIMISGIGQVQYSYDDLNRLITVEYQNGLQTQYTYDPLGNRLTKTSSYLIPAAAGAISGPAVVCAGDDSVVYSVAAVANTAWYIWSLPIGAVILSGDSTRTILVSFNTGAQSGNVTVFGKNPGGSGAVSPPLAVTVKTVPGAPGTISGPVQVQQGQTGVNYSVTPVSGATGYLWTLPPGTSITAGQNTAAITVAFSASSVTGEITVKGTNDCGNGPLSQPFQVTVTAGVPATLAIQNTTIQSGDDACYDALQTITVAGGGSYFTLQSGGITNFIAGQKITFRPGAKALSGSYLHARIAPNGPWCNNVKSSITDTGNENIPEFQSTGNDSEFKALAFPNPVSSLLTVVWTASESGNETVLEIVNLLGTKLFSTRVLDRNSAEIDMDSYPPGICFLKVQRENQTVILKIIRH